MNNFGLNCMCILYSKATTISRQIIKLILKKLVANYFDNLLYLQVILPSKNVKHLLISSSYMLGFTALPFLIVTEGPLGFRPLAGQKQFEDVTSGSEKLG